MTDRTGLLTDRYELTMLDSWVRDGSAADPAVFEVFARRLPEGRRYGVLAGLGRLLPLIEAFTFDSDDVHWLVEAGVVGPETADYLRAFRFTGDVDAYPEGDLYFPGSPVLTVRGTLGEVLEEPAAAMVSGLPLLNKPMRTRIRLINEAFGLMQDKAPFVQFTYSMAAPPIPKGLSRIAAEASERIWMNLPPARVWCYRRALVS